MNDANLLDVWTHHLDPMRAEIRIRLHNSDPNIELRGRLMGPRCHFATTLEVAYPFRRVGESAEFAALIPDPSLWTPAKPFLYEGPVVWTGADGEAVEIRPRVCLRTLKRGTKGWALNNQLLQVRGQDITHSSEAPAEDELLELRRQGFNALVADTDRGQVPALAESADRLGFLLILREAPGDNGQESFHCRLSQHSPSGNVALTGVSRQGDGIFTLV